MGTELHTHSHINTYLYRHITVTTKNDTLCTCKTRYTHKHMLCTKINGKSSICKTRYTGTCTCCVRRMRRICTVTQTHNYTRASAHTLQRSTCTSSTHIHIHNYRHALTYTHRHVSATQVHAQPQACILYYVYTRRPSHTCISPTS